MTISGSNPREALRLFSTIKEWRTSGFVRTMQRLFRDHREDTPGALIYGLRPRRFATVQGDHVLHVFVEDPNPTQLRRWISLWWCFDSTEWAELWLVERPAGKAGKGWLVSPLDLEALSLSAPREE